MNGHSCGRRKQGLGLANNAEKGYLNALGKVGSTKYPCFSQVDEADSLVR
jgi:hypothetical protein